MDGLSTSFSFVVLWAVRVDGTWMAYLLRIRSLFCGLFDWMEYGLLIYFVFVRCFGGCSSRWMAYLLRFRCFVGYLSVGGNGWLVGCDLGTFFSTAFRCFNF